MSDLHTDHTDLVFLVLKYLDEKGYKEAAHVLKRESGIYFDMNYFEEVVFSGKWDVAERYLSGFTKLGDNRYSRKIYFEMRKQHYLEALDKKCHTEALDVLTKDLQVFAEVNQELYRDITQLMTYDNIREYDSLSTYGDTMSARKCMMKEIRMIIEANPIFRGKLLCPGVKQERLQLLINQCLNWQHMQSQHPHLTATIDTLFADHVCDPQYLNLQAMPIENGAKSTTSQCPGIDSVDTVILGSTTGQVMDNSDGLSKRLPFEILAKATSTITDPGQIQFGDFAIPIDLPTTVVRTLSEGSSPMSMDFHPVWPTILLVGTSAGEVGLWDVISGAEIVDRTFSVWNLEACSMALKVALERDSHVSVNCVLWSPDDILFGVAYSKHIVQLYTYTGGDELQQVLQIDAHLGGVNDLAFSSPNGELLVITCGDDKIIKVWQVVSGNQCYSFRGHNAPVYSVCPLTNENMHFIYSVSRDGKIKLWLYDNFGERVDNDTPGCTKIAYSADEQRFFSCGNNRGEPFLGEWDEVDGSFKRVYQGLATSPLSAVQFDTTKNQILAAGDGHMVKYWHMDNTLLLKSVDADGGLPANPHIRFNTDGALLAVTSNENQIKILANANALDLLQGCKICSIGAFGVESEVSTKNGEPRNVAVVNSKTFGEANNREKAWETIERHSQCHSLQLCADVERIKISKLIYTNAGNAILALASNGIHLLWKWPQNDLNSNGKASTKVRPSLWQPTNGKLMRNDISNTNSEEAMPCFSLSKNDYYLMSASGGMVSLFNFVSFKTMRKIMTPAPAATCLAFDPHDNNLVAIGMDDSTIMIYNAHLGKVTSTLEGHTKRVTCLAFSTSVKSLVSSGADAQIIVWNADPWKIQRSKSLQIPDENKSTAAIDSAIHIQFHKNQLHFLAVVKTHLAIYEVNELQCVNKWVSDSSVPISHATLSCDSRAVYASFVDGTLGIFDASALVLYCQIKPSAYLPADISYTGVYPLVIAAHPQKPSQFALGLSNGEVHLLEPLESEGAWAKLT